MILPLLFVMSVFTQKTNKKAFAGIFLAGAVCVRVEMSGQESLGAVQQDQQPIHIVGEIQIGGTFVRALFAGSSAPDAAQTARAASAAMPPPIRPQRHLIGGDISR